MSEFEKDRQKVIRDIKMLYHLSKYPFLPLLFGIVIFPLITLLFNLQSDTIAMVLVLSLLSGISILELEIKFKEEFMFVKKLYEDDKDES